MNTRSFVFKSYVLLLVLCIVCVSSATTSEGKPYRDIYSDTWVATDALGRTMPDFAKVGPVKKDQRRVVGIFYMSWHSDGLAARRSPYSGDVTKILATDPEARLDAGNPLWDGGEMHHWGEPELGYFLSRDEYVIFNEMSMLVDAGVDVLILDVTNGVEYWDEWAKKNKCS